jgi:hypothetical protein
VENVIGCKHAPDPSRTCPQTAGIPAHPFPYRCPAGRRESAINRAILRSQDFDEALFGDCEA